MPYPAPPVCLTVPYSAKPWQKGGTLIAEEVTSRVEHRRWLADPDGYRPECCRHCGLRRLHAHDFRERVLRAEPGTPVEMIRRYLCAACKAVWQVLPGFIARHLHRSWPVVQSAAVANGDIAATGGERRVPVPGRTVRRWSSRLGASAAQLIQVVSAAAGQEVTELLRLTGTACDRAAFVDAVAEVGLGAPAAKLHQLAGWLHRLVPGIRLM